VGRSRTTSGGDTGAGWRSLLAVFGLRYRLQNLLCCLVFGGVLFLFCWYHFTIQHAGFWLVLAYTGFILPVFVLALSACTTRVTLSPRGLVVCRFGIEATRFKWSEIRAVSRSPVTPTIVFVTDDRRRFAFQHNSMASERYRSTYTMSDAVPFIGPS
jgi:hypothetical protein